MSNNKNGKNEKVDDDIGNKEISNSTGNNGKEIAKEENPYNLTGKAFENWKLNQEFIAKKGASPVEGIGTHHRIQPLRITNFCVRV